MTGTQESPSNNKQHCDKCGRDVNARGFYQHYKNCTGDPNRPFTASERKIYDRQVKAGKGPVTPKPVVNTPKPIVNETIAPPVEVPVSMPDVHTTVPLNPSTNEHGGIVQQDPEPRSEPDDDEDNEEWDGYLW